MGTAVTVSPSSFYYYKTTIHNQKVTVIFQESPKTSVYVNLQVSRAFERLILTYLIFPYVFVSLFTLAMNADK